MTDANYPAKSYAIRAVKTLDGSSCEPRTRDGTAMSMIDSSKGLQQAQKCVDFGVSNSKVGVQQFKTGADAMAPAAAPMARIRRPDNNELGGLSGGGYIDQPQR